MKSIRFGIFFLACLAVISGCERTYDPIPPYLETMYPVTQGGQRTYFVIDTSYISSSTQGYDARTYFKREVTDGTETDLLGREVSKLYLYESSDTLMDSLGNPVYNWQYSDLWTQYTDDEFAERIEGNVRYLVLRQPPVEGATWNGNLYNSEDTQRYEVINDDTTVTVQGVTYEHCVFVLQVPYRFSPIPAYYNIEYAYEIYAPGIGKIVRYSKYFESQSGDVNADKSHVYFEELVGHNY